MATIQFEKYNGGVPFRTSFYTADSTGMLDDGTATITGAGSVFQPTSATDSEPGVGFTLSVRSYELYIDTTVSEDDGDANVAGTVQRIAKVTTDPTDLVGYDVLVTAASPVGNVTALSAFSVSLQNISGSTADIRTVFVCDVVPV